MSNGSVRNGVARLFGVLIALLVAAACVPPLSSPGNTGSIQLVSTSVESGYRVEYYRNTAYPCSISGYQTFTIAYREGQPATTAAPLWTYLHGGAVGWFDSSGKPRPDDAFMREEGPAPLTSGGGLTGKVLADPAGFRRLGVSMCNRDLYSGGGLVDPNNPNKLANGSARTTNGLFATKAAIQFTRNRFATTKHFVQGGSAGSIGAYSVAWSLQQQGLAPAGIVADSFVLNQEWGQAVQSQGVPCPTAELAIANMTAIKALLHPDIGDIANATDKLVAEGRFTVPIAQVWSHGDPWGCGSTPMVCPLRDGTTVVLGGTDCMNEPLRRVIAAQGPSSRSLSLSLCVDAGCSRHVLTSSAGVEHRSAGTGRLQHGSHDMGPEPPLRPLIHPAMPDLGCNSVDVVTGNDPGDRSRDARVNLATSPWTTERRVRRGGPPWSRERDNASSRSLAFSASAAWHVLRGTSAHPSLCRRSQRPIDDEYGWDRERVHGFVPLCRTSRLVINALGPARCLLSPPEIAAFGRSSSERSCRHER